MLVIIRTPGTVVPVVLCFSTVFFSSARDPQVPLADHHESLPHDQK